jgi:hypothetical protein
MAPGRPVEQVEEVEEQQQHLEAVAEGGGLSRAKEVSAAAKDADGDARNKADKLAKCLLGVSMG